MQATHISSSNVDAVGYRKPSQLVIRFRSGGTYLYEKVPFAYFIGLQEALSAGQYFHKYIRGKFPFQKLDHDPFQGGA